MEVERRNESFINILLNIVSIDHMIAYCFKVQVWFNKKLIVLKENGFSFLD